MVQHGRLLQPQLVRTQQQFGEIHQPAAVAVILVNLVDVHPGGRDRVIEMLDMLRPLALVLARIDEPLRLACRPMRLVHAFVANDAAQQALLVFGIENLEGFGQSGFLEMHPQQTMGDAVKRADPQRPR